MIPFVSLPAQHEPLAEEIHEALARVVGSGRFTLGPEVEAFEVEFAAYSGARYGIGVNSGTSALHLALLASGAGPGDEVITTPLTFAATVAAIEYTGARPVLADIDPEYLTLDPEKVEAAITPRTKAIVPVHLHGQPCDMDSIMGVARRHGLKVVEDAAQAHGAEYRGRRAGSLGDAACFSFYPTKNLGACGEGGMVLTSDSGLARTVRQLRDWGQEAKNKYVLKGFNYRMEAFQGAILRIKLRRLPEWTEARRRLAAQYGSRLAGSAVRVPREMPETRHVFHVYAVRSQRRDALADQLRGSGVETAVHYARPVHLLEPWSDLGYRAGGFPHAEAACREILSLPLYPELRADQVERVCQAVNQASVRSAYA